MMRIDTAHTFLGIRLNVWTSLAILALGLLVYSVAGNLGRSTILQGDERFVPAETDENASEIAEHGNDHLEIESLNKSSEAQSG
ncbi:Uncharacterised protein [Chlamydia trachomatis]|nr:Uncharacterised protein [Chlamydia trachomatis]